MVPLPRVGFDPSEAAIPWQILKQNGCEVIFATPDAAQACCDLRMLRGDNLGLLAPFLQADSNAQQAYAEMEKSSEFRRPIAWQDIKQNMFDGLLLPGGHAKEVREYLESSCLQKTVTDFFQNQKPVAAICHGVVLAARSQTVQGKSVLFGKKTTALLASQELLAWALTCLWLGDYYRTYSQTVEEEVQSVLANKKDFIKGPLPITRDSSEHPERGFCLQDGNYLSARWPGDAHRFALQFVKMLRT